MPRVKESNTLTFVKCPVCKKEFLPAPYHVFRLDGKYMCSYSCYNKQYALRKRVRTVKE